MTRLLHPGIITIFAALLLAAVEPAFAGDAGAPPSLTAEELKADLKTWDDHWNRVRFGHEYQKALTHFMKRVEKEPENPLSYVSVAVVRQAQLLELYSPELEAEFYKYIDLTIEKAEAILEVDERNAAAYFLIGAASGYKAIWQSMNRQWISSWRSGRKATGSLDKAVEIDPSIDDAYYGLGLFNYWRSEKSRIFWWLPWISDKRQMGIDQLHRTIEHGLFAGPEAKASMVYVWFQQDEPKKMLQYAQELYEYLNYSRFYKRLLADAWLKNNGGKQAEELYTSVYEELRKEPHATKHNLILYRFRIAETIAYQARWDEAEAMCIDILNDDYPDTEAKPPNFKRRYNEVKGLLERCRKWEHRFRLNN